jgi:lysophospholipase L1-like esterase
MSSKRLWVVAVLAAALALPATAAAAPRFVGLGDSYAAGPLIPVQLPPFGCLKSSSNYAHLAELTLRFREFRDISCSGAETEDMTQAQNVTPGPNPPQFDALTADTRLVTLSIGGNDIGFSSIAQSCLRTTPSSGSPCKDSYVVNGRDEISERIAATAPKVAAVLQGIRERSPNAKTLVINYSAIFPHTGGGCWPQIPVAEGDVPWLRAKQEELNAMLAQQVAAAQRTRLVDVYSASRGHDACQPPAIRWVEPLVPANAAAPLHPNILAMREISRLVIAASAAG